MADFIEIEDLPSTSLPTPSHRIPAQVAGGGTVFLTAGQITRQILADKAANYTATVDDHGSVFACSTTLQINLPSLATIPEGYFVAIEALGGPVTLDPNGVQQIDGSSTPLVLPLGMRTVCIATATGWRTSFTMPSLLTSLNSIFTTRGDLLRRGATFAERVALGTAGQALQSDGTDPIWAESDFKLLDQGVFANVANLDIVLIPFQARGFKRFKFRHKAWHGSADGAIMKMQLSNNGGSSFTASGYGGNMIFAQGATLNSAAIGATGFELSIATGNLATELSWGQCYLEIDGTISAVYGQGHGITPTPTHASFTFGGYANVGNTNAIRITPSTGTHAAGPLWFLEGAK